MASPIPRANRSPVRHEGVGLRLARHPRQNALSPELSPDEWVWHNITRDRVAKMAARSLEEMKAGIEKAVERLQAHREIVLGFFRSPDLAYIKA